MPSTHARDEPYGPPTAYLFQCRNDLSLFAVSVHENAGNIPPSTTWYGGWRLRGAFALAAAEAADADAKHIANRVRSIGYYVWRDGLC